MINGHRPRLSIDTINARGIRATKFRQRPREHLDELEACYQCIVIVREHPELGARLLELRGEDRKWRDCLARLTPAT